MEYSLEYWDLSLVLMEEIAAGNYHSLEPDTLIDVGLVKCCDRKEEAKVAESSSFAEVAVFAHLYLSWSTEKAGWS